VCGLQSSAERAAAARLPTSQPAASSRAAAAGLSSYYYSAYYVVGVLERQFRDWRSVCVAPAGLATTVYSWLTERRSGLLASLYYTVKLTYRPVSFIS